VTAGVCGGVVFPKRKKKDVQIGGGHLKKKPKLSGYIGSLKVSDVLLGFKRGRSSLARHLGERVNWFNTGGTRAHKERLTVD